MNRRTTRLAPSSCLRQQGFRGALQRLTMTLMLVMLTTVTAWADGSWTSGDCTVTLTGNALTVSKTDPNSATGAMADYSSSDNQPWKNFRDKIESLVIKKDVTGIGNYAFADCENLGSVKYEAGTQLTTIGNNAFADCPMMASVYIPSSVTTIGDNAFACQYGYLKNVFACPVTPPDLGEDVFQSDYSIIYTVRNEDYKDGDNYPKWSAMADNMTVGASANFDIPYIDADGNDAICPYATPISSSNCYFDYNGDLWYYVSGNGDGVSYLSFPQDESFGTANIILCNNATLTVSYISSNANLSIYRQENNTGKITIENGSYSGINAGKSIFINGGTINISGSSYEYGIYSDDGDITLKGSDITIEDATKGISSSGNVTINGGNITVTGATSDYGAIYSSSGDITINSGNIKVTDATYYSFYSANRNIIVNGGDINITIEAEGSNISTGFLASSGSVTINDGKVTVDKSYSGISATDVIIEGGEISVSVTGSDSYSNGIYSQSGNITINDGKVTAISTNGAAIRADVNITLVGGTVTATSTNGTGISAGYDITLNGGTVNATSTNGAGIYVGFGNNLTLGDAIVTASSYNIENDYGFIKIAENLLLYDGANTYSGTLFDGNNTDNGKFVDLETLNTALTGKTLQKLPDYIDLSVTLEWDDNNQSNSRPEAVTVSLKGDGKVVATCELSGSGEWKHTETHLPSLKLGAPIVYNWELEDMPNGYKLTSNTVGTATTLTLTLQQCGDVEWSYNQISKTLTISGTGAMANYSSTDVKPWSSFRDEIESLVIKKDVTSIGSYAFADCENLGAVKYEAGTQLTTIGNNAFADCPMMASVYIPSSVTTIGDNAFACPSGYLKNVFACPVTPPTLGEDVFQSDYSIIYTVRSNSYTTATGWKDLSNMTVGDAANFDIPYIDADGNDAICPYAIPISSSNTIYYNGDLWYYVSGEVASGYSLSFSQDDFFGTANIILCDGAEHTISNLSSLGNIDIYSQQGNTGKISVKDGSYNGISANKNLTINGGTIDISGTSYSNSIRAVKDITINGGTINDASNGIISDDGSVTINGSTIKTTGINSSNGNLTITDGDIELTGGGLSASNLTINSGDVTITNENGYGFTCGDLTINDGKITIEDSYGGISTTNNVIIEGGEVSISATGSSYDCSGIMSYGNVTINGGEITTSAIGENAAGIYANDITLAGGTVTATSTNGAGIFVANSKSLVLAGATVTASSYNIENESGSIKITDGLFMSDGSKAYSGTLFDGSVYPSIGKFASLDDLNAALEDQTLQRVPDKIDLTAKIIWNDNNDQYNKRPTSVNVKLRADGDEVDTYELTEDENGEWKCTATDLSSLNEGELIDYTWEVTGQLDDYVLTSNTAVGTATTLTLSVTVPLFAANSSNLWMTWCDKNAYTKPEGVTVYTVSGVDNNTVSTAEVSGDVIPAYTPVLLCRSTVGADAVKATFNAVGTAPDNYDSNSGIVETTGSGNATFLGIPGDDAYAPGDNNNIFAISDLSDTQSYVLRNGNFVAVDEDGGIAPHRCWLNVTKSTTNGARMLSINTGGENTGIETTNFTNSTNSSGAWYGIDGRKLDKQPTKKGLYINNGKKYVIK